MGEKSRYRDLLKSLNNSPSKSAKVGYPPNARPLSLEGRSDDTIKAYEYIPTENELKEMERSLERSKESRARQANKPPRNRDTRTLATAILRK